MQCSISNEDKLQIRGSSRQPVCLARFSVRARSDPVRPRRGPAGQPQHLLAETADGEILGAAPCYLKSHSRGEYVFDHGWADAYERAGGSYYPKLQVSVPFTPATGPRLLVAAAATRRDGARRRSPRGLIALVRAARRPRRSMSPSCQKPNGSFLAARGLSAAHRPAIPLEQ